MSTSGKIGNKNAKKSDSTGESVGRTAPQQINPISTTQPTDSYIPSYLSKLVPELNYYEQLLDAEKKLDIYMARKRIDLHQNIAQWTSSNFSSNASAIQGCNQDNKYLRVFISNTSENQPWQDPSQELTSATWTLRIEGRLLDSQGVQDTNRPKFSSFFQAIAVDFKKPEFYVNESNTNGTSTEPNTLSLALPGQNQDIEMTDADQANPNNTPEQQSSDIADAIEWHFDPKNPVEFDGIDIKRQGSENVQCTITIQLKDITGSELTFSHQLTNIIGLTQGSLHTAVYSIYKYILINKLLINDEAAIKSRSSSSENTNGEKTIVQLDEFLSVLVPNEINSEGVEVRPSTIKLVDLLPLVNQHVSPLKPITFGYTVRVDKSSTYGDLVFDLEVRDPSLTQQKQTTDSIGREYRSILSDLDNLTTESKPKLDELEVTRKGLQLQLNASANKYQFFKKISDDPVPALQEYIASSANSLKVLSGDEGYNEDMVRKSQFYKENEAVLFENLGVLLSN